MHGVDPIARGTALSAQRGRLRSRGGNRSACTRAGSARTADAMLLTVVLLWSGNFTAMRYGVESFHPLAFSAVRFGLGAALYALVVLVAGALAAHRAARLRRHPPARRSRHLRQPGRGHLRRAEGRRRERRHAHGERADHRGAARPPARARAHRRAARRRHRRRGDGSAARPLRRWRHRRRTADRLAARPRDRGHLGELLRAAAPADGALQRRAAVGRGAAHGLGHAHPRLAAAARRAGLGRARTATPGSRSATAWCSRCWSRTCSGSTRSTASAQPARRSSSTSSRSASR